jgi:hypothetical protein
MAEYNFTGGRDGTFSNSFVGFRGLQGRVTVPAGPHRTNNGHWPVIVTGISGTVRGGATTLAGNQATNPSYVSRNITLELDDATTAVFTVAGGSPITTGLKDISKYYNGISQLDGVSRGDMNAQFRIRNAFVDAYLRYGWQPTAGNTLYSMNGNLSNTSVQGILRNPGAPTGYLRYIYAPSEPRNLRFSSNESTSVTLAWDSPSSDGESAITAWRLEWSRDEFANVEGSTFL